MYYDVNTLPVMGRSINRQETAAAGCAFDLQGSGPDWEVCGRSCQPQAAAVHRISGAGTVQGTRGLRGQRVAAEQLKGEH